MGTIGKDRSMLSPVYGLIFTRMERTGLDWRYTHPRLNLVDLGDREDDTGSQRCPFVRRLRVMPRRR
jgi:hypothetical protein